MKYAVDRIIEDKFICESLADGSKMELLAGEVRGHIREGDIIIRQGDQYIKDEEETATRRKNMQNMLNKLMNKEKQG